MSPHTGVLLVNLGTPDSPQVPDVRRYLREFLMDGRVIDIPAWQRFLLVQGIIAPFRAPKSAAEYQKLWTESGSPLLIYGVKIREMLQAALGEEYQVELGMRYQNPSIREALDKFALRSLKKLVVVPLYPQYASASTGSSIEKVLDELRRMVTFSRRLVRFRNWPCPRIIAQPVGRKKKAVAQNVDSCQGRVRLPVLVMLPQPKPCLEQECSGTSPINL